MNTTTYNQSTQASRQSKQSVGSSVSIIAVAILALSSFLLLFAAPPVYAQELQPVEELVIVDANGNKVGTVLDSVNDRYTIVMKYGERIFQLFIENNGDDFWYFSLFFESTDCSGTPFVSNSFRNKILQIGTIAPPNRTVYLPDLDAAPRVITRMSVISALSLGECVPSVYTFLASPALPVVDLDTVFTPPFSMRDNAEPDLEDLQQQVTDIQTDLFDHSHTYLTGKGKGHNKTQASAGPATFPAEP